jgi:hypothetical protein
MSGETLFKGLGDKLSQPHPTQRCLGLHSLEERIR